MPTHDLHRLLCWPIALSVECTTHYNQMHYIHTLAFSSHDQRLTSDHWLNKDSYSRSIICLNNYEVECRGIFFYLGIVYPHQNRGGVLCLCPRGKVDFDLGWICAAFIMPFEAICISCVQYYSILLMRLPLWNIDVIICWSDLRIVCRKWQPVVNVTLNNFFNFLSM